MQLESLSSFPTCVSFGSIWCEYTVVMTQPKLGINPVLFISEINNQLIGVAAFLIHILTSLLVDEILLSRYGNWSTNHRGVK